MSNQLEGIEQKDIIKRVTGKVTKLWEPKTFNGPKGEFVIQGGDIEIDGQTYGLKFFNNTQEQSIKGNVVTLSSVRGKHGLTGVSLEHESYDGKNGRVDRDIIKVTATGKVEFDRPSEEPARVASPATPKSIVTDNPEQALDEIVELHQYIDSLVRMAYLGKITDEETLRSYVSSVFIEANRKGIHYSTKTEAPKKEEPVKEELNPDDWGSAIVPEGHPKFKELGGKKLAEIGKPALTKLYEYFLEKGFTTPFAKCVEKAAEDLNLDAPVEEADEIPW